MGFCKNENISQFSENYLNFCNLHLNYFPFSNRGMLSTNNKIRLETLTASIQTGEKHISWCVFFIKQNQLLTRARFRQMAQ